LRCGGGLKVRALGFGLPLWHTGAHPTGGRRKPLKRMLTKAASIDPTRGELEVERFADETLALVCRSLGAQWGSWYRIGPDLRPFAFRLHGIPPDFGAAYSRNHMEDVDPLHPFRLVPRRRRFAMLADARAESLERHRDFISFLHSFGAHEEGEMIFRCSDHAVAGLSLVWTEKRPEHRAVSELGSTLQSYVEFNLGNLWRANGWLPSVDAGTGDGEFSRREVEVIDGVCRGFTNQQIAQQLNIGIATVKTHLIHVFKKAGVETRGELISRMLARGGSRVANVG
jgi:DNA-binding CsgD family transcriptional regulator